MTENNILISIITINFNNANGLEKTINSVRNQTYQNYEHIIIDGGSVDKSVEVIESFLSDTQYAQHISYWCSEKDKGIYNAMNKGIEHANGKFVYMLNSGDELYNNCFEQISTYLENESNCVLYGAVDCYNDIQFSGTVCPQADNLYKLMIPHQGVFVSLELHRKYGLYNENFKILADRELMVRLFKNDVSFIHIPFIICKYYLDGISSKNAKLIDKEAQIINNSFYSKNTLIYRKIRHFIRIIFEFLMPGFITIPLLNIIRRVRNKD